MVFGKKKKNLWEHFWAEAQKKFPVQLKKWTEYLDENDIRVLNRIEFTVHYKVDGKLYIKNIFGIVPAISILLDVQKDDVTIAGGPNGPCRVTGAARCDNLRILVPSLGFFRDGKKNVAITFNREGWEPQQVCDARRQYFVSLLRREGEKIARTLK